MKNTFVRCLGIAFCLGSSALFANPLELDRAIKQYYAGNPGQAIATLEPLALAGDAKAQTLLGNIIYGLSKSGQLNTTEELLKWYRIAASQGSSEASYALGSIYHNQWLQSQDEADAKFAEHYFKQAADRGYEKALGPLMKLSTRAKPAPAQRSLVYDNSSFASKQLSPTQPVAESADNANNNAMAELLAKFVATGDPSADTARLQTLMRQLDKNNGDITDTKTLTGLLTGLGATDSLLSDILQLIENIRSATEPGMTPGAK